MKFMMSIPVDKQRDDAYRAEQLGKLDPTTQEGIKAVDKIEKVKGAAMGFYGGEDTRITGKVHELVDALTLAGVSLVPAEEAAIAAAAHTGSAAAGSLAGIGFTMSLFIADLGFLEGTLPTEAKIGFRSASIIPGIVGSIIVLATGKEGGQHGSEETAPAEPGSTRMPIRRPRSTLTSPKRAHDNREAMRLDTFQRSAIKNAVRKHFGDDARVLLFGSRVNDAARGGDIDLLVETDRFDARTTDAVDRKLTTISDIQRRIGERKIDLVLANSSSHEAVVEQARAMGVEL